MVLQLLAGSVLSVNGASTVGRVFFVQGSHAGLLNVFFGRTVKLFLEDGIGVVDLELGLEVPKGLSGGVGTTANVAQVIAQVFGLDAFASPTPALDRQTSGCIPSELTSYRGHRRAS